MKKLTAVFLACALFVTTGCESIGQVFGTLGGGALGAWAGSGVGSGTGRLVGVAVGTLAGAWAGSQIARAIDQRDKTVSQKATREALDTLPSGKSVVWKNPDTGNSGTVTPVTTSEIGGRYCREFAQTILVGGSEERGYGRACREADGSWKIVN